MCYIFFLPHIKYIAPCEKRNVKKMWQAENIIFNSDLSPANVAQIIVDNGKQSQVIKDIRTADRYFDIHNDIEEKTRSYFDKDGKSIANPAANNARIKSNFLRMQVQQKQDYGFAKSFVLKLSTEKQSEIDLAEDAYGLEWKNFLEKILYKMTYRLAGQAVNHGIAWCYVWIDENGELNLEDLKGDLVYPVWKDRQHVDLNSLVYNYFQLEYKNLEPTKTEFAELWTETEHFKFDVSDGYKDVPFFTDSHSHMTNGVSWEKIPIIPLKSTDDEKPLVLFIKDYIDSYDKLISRSIDGLIDDLDPMLVFKGISPDVRDLIEARELAKMTRTISLDSDGDASYIQAQTSVDAHLKELETLKSDMIKFSYGVDMNDARFGGNPNQLVIKSLYQDLDTYTDGIERHFQSFIEQLKYFFDKWYEITGRGSFAEAQEYKILVKLDRSMLINQSALIDDTVKLQGTGVSQKTLLEFNPVIQDVELEQKRLEDEKAENDIFRLDSEPDKKQDSDGKEV